MPENWQTGSLNYAYGDTVYHIAVGQTRTADGSTGCRTTLDGVDQGNEGIALIDDHYEHRVEVRIQRACSPEMASVQQRTPRSKRQQASGTQAEGTRT